MASPCRKLGSDTQCLQSFPENSTHPLLLKLHGSTNWFRLRPDDGTWYDERIGIAVDGDYEHTRDSHGRLQTPVPHRPLFLVGTFNKIADYSQELFAALLSCFTRVSFVR